MYYLNCMKTTGVHNYFVYITTNKNKTVLYTGITNDLRIRLIPHLEKSTCFPSTSFAGKYNAVYLIYYERFEYVEHAIEREKEIKVWRRSKKDALIATMNPEWKFLNDEIE
jgi:putative endonuclease